MLSAEERARIERRINVIAYPEDAEAEKVEDKVEGVKIKKSRTIKRKAPKPKKKEDVDDADMVVPAEKPNRKVLNKGKSHAVNEINEPGHG